MNTHIDEAIEVLQKTHDGNDLSPRDLALVQLAGNNDLSALGETEWAALVVKVRAGYVKPWHCDVENLTKDHAGYIYWRGVNIEHYSYNDANAERIAAEELGAACRFVEAHGDIVNTTTVWPAMDRMRAGSMALTPICCRTSRTASKRA